MKQIQKRIARAAKKNTIPRLRQGEWSKLVAMAIKRGW